MPPARNRGLRVKRDCRQNSATTLLRRQAALTDGPEPQSQLTPLHQRWPVDCSTAFSHPTLPLLITLWGWMHLLRVDRFRASHRTLRVNGSSSSGRLHRVSFHSPTHACRRNNGNDRRTERAGGRTAAQPGCRLLVLDWWMMGIDSCWRHRAERQRNVEIDAHYPCLLHAADTHTQVDACTATLR